MFKIIGLLVSLTIPVLATTAHTPLRYASFDSITVLKPFQIEANNTTVCFYNGEPRGCAGKTDYCLVHAQNVSPHDRSVGALGLPKTIRATVLEDLASSQYVQVVKIALKGTTLADIACVRMVNENEGQPEVADFQKHFGAYLRLDLHDPDLVDPIYE